MWTLIRNGGVIPMSVLLLFGAVALLSAFYFAIAANRRVEGFVTGMIRATLFTTLAATFADIGATFTAVTNAFQKPDAAPLQVVAMLCEGIAESTSPGILGFSFVALAWMLVAVGRRREAPPGLGEGA